MCGMGLMKDGSLLLIFMADCLVSLTDWVNNTFVAFLLLGLFPLNVDTIWLVWAYEMTDMPLIVCILS